ncbi:MAG: DNA cytosine methyltransferase [Candidatus Pacebacteria bacterium]|nr:DNA cytosine methyltransferase [Candidatus Paceibacterota bacterium]
MFRKPKQLTVIDFFCGAGGFSEGFRQQGFKIVKGIDFWQPAIDTHNLNHGLNDTTKDVLDFWGKNSADVEEIEKLEDTEFLIGSPSCVSFSMSNKSGKGDKTLGIKLIKAYLRVIVVKKHQNETVLKGWYMENVPKSRDFIREKYTFEQLNLAKWAEKIGCKKTDIALKIQGEILNAGDYGAPQERKRFIAGEWIKTGEFISPTIIQTKHKTVSEVRSRMPKTTEKKNSKKKFADPNYQNIKLEASEITDHFYDTGVYKIEWEKAEFLKTNHPFMGKMSFPENENRTSRTIMATRSASTREAIIYKSEYNRSGDGEYRLPTIREVASLMGFPYVYQFVGSEGTKWRQIGNSVCPHQSISLAKALRKKMGLKKVPDDKIHFFQLKENYKKIKNLNTFEEKKFNSLRKRLKNTRFRRHAIKLGNMTVDLMNYHPEKKNEVAQNWYVVAFFGTGDGYGVKIFSSQEKEDLANVLKGTSLHFDEYKKIISSLPVNVSSLQEVYEQDLHLKQESNPILLLKNLSQIISSYKCHKEVVSGKGILQKDNIPIAQLMSAYGLLSLLNN